MIFQFVRVHMQIAECLSSEFVATVNMNAGSESLKLDPGVDC